MGKGCFEEVEPIWRQFMEGYGMQLSIQGLVAEGWFVASKYTVTDTFSSHAFGHEPTGQS
jgi:predicted ester cyclase